MGRADLNGTRRCPICNGVMVGSMCARHAKADEMEQVCRALYRLITDPMLTVGYTTTIAGSRAYDRALAHAARLLSRQPNTIDRTYRVG